MKAWYWKQPTRRRNPAPVSSKAGYHKAYLLHARYGLSAVQYLATEYLRRHPSGEA